MRKSKIHYAICKSNNNKTAIVKIKKTKGFSIVPKNNILYDGIKVNKLLILKKKFIVKLLKKKIKRKLDLYLDLIVDIADVEESNQDGDAFKESLNEVSRFKDIVRYKYKKYLDAKYINLLTKKIELLEYELKERLVTNYFEYEEEPEKEIEEEHKKR